MYLDDFRRLRYLRSNQTLKSPWEQPPFPQISKIPSRHKNSLYVMCFFRGLVWLISSELMLLPSASHVWKNGDRNQYILQIHLDFDFPSTSLRVITVSPPTKNIAQTASPWLSWLLSSIWRLHATLFVETPQRPRSCHACGSILGIQSEL